MAGLAAELCGLYGMSEVLIAPGEGTPEETAADVGAVLGRYLSGAIQDGMVIGAGWGRTLAAALATFRPQRRRNVEVVSLLGGLLAPDTLNPIDFSWQIATALGAECSLFLAPLIVDSPETKDRLLDACGLGALTEMAQRLDLAVVSCGDVGPGGSSFSRQFLLPDDLDGLLAAGAICDTLCQFLDAEGRTIDHPIRHRVMSVDLDIVASAPHVILASGGRARAPAIRAAILRTRCRTLVTDEAAARELVALSAAGG
ncbi:MAG: sugar-binding domain-containing protein [Amaricoccus sp.]